MKIKYAKVITNLQIELKITKIADMGQPVEQNKISGFSVPDERWTNKIQNVRR